MIVYDYDCVDCLTTCDLLNKLTVNRMSIPINLGIQLH